MSRPAAPLKGRAGRLARMLPSTGPSSAARTPFVLLVVLLLGGGLITLLLLNSALNEGSFRLSKLKRETTELTDEQQALQRDVDGYSQPGALERRARELGMVPGGSPAFLNPDGTVRGVPTTATAPPPSPTPSPSADADADPSAGASPGATPAGGAQADAAADGAPPASPGASPDADATAAVTPSPGAPPAPAAQGAPAAENPPATPTPPPTTPGR
ncbi:MULTISPECIES: septum formation initiator [Streptomyces]|uniref:septum formation initiator n=1 Tax=Streptomyces TaxID=1883 RepID=UPI0010403F86|nr:MULTISPECIES: septum formation initiator [Streptomyces]MBT3074166.1 septum formation initiator [Streptomyces sp. COG21]MBT3084076.1 septum formation initiator [Streptomyces sp. COG20]MBT3086403.1 septum formation initiator [Streptomyces sp. CYG21]MBT3100957.1 septum formation initiator [Streptomyces sp. CBG30]MBT3101280.1 septum formation initiator [Streptomyces sp. COG19]